MSGMKMPPQQGTTMQQQQQQQQQQPPQMKQFGGNMMAMTMQGMTPQFCMPANQWGMQGARFM